MERATLEDLLGEGLSLDGIATRVARSPSTVSYWLKRHGLGPNGARKYRAKGGLPRAELERFSSEGLSVASIARRLECHPSMVRRWLDRHGLVIRQARNRELARVAEQRGERVAELHCVRHGETAHVRDRRGTYRCARCNAAGVSERRRKVKRLLVEEAGGRCQVCGYDRCQAALAFHHLDPAEKSFHIALRGASRSLARARAEAAKCLLLCANCHAEVEAGVTSSDHSPGWIRTTTP